MYVQMKRFRKEIERFMIEVFRRHVALLPNATPYTNDSILLSRIDHTYMNERRTLLPTTTP